MFHHNRGFLFDMVREMTKERKSWMQILLIMQTLLSKNSLDDRIRRADRAVIGQKNLLFCSRFQDGEHPRFVENENVRGCTRFPHGDGQTAQLKMRGADCSSKVR
jgi:hypothetical protein